MNQEIAHKWMPLQGLPDNYDDLCSSELTALAEIWQEQKDHLAQSDSLRVFNERLQRQWAIETGIIERIYSLDRGITQILIERGIDASLISHNDTDKDPELVARIIRDHEEALEGLFAFVKGDRPLSTGYIKELHAILLRNQQTALGRNTLGRMVDAPLLRGEYKKTPNNPTRPNGRIHEYCPPEQVASDMDRLIDLHNQHEDRGVPPELESAWFHHRFSQIHPFQDGNGRVGRALASLIFIKADWFPLAVTRDDREQYIDALEEADRGNLQDLVTLFSSLQRRAFVKALGLASEVLLQERVDQVITAARDVFQRRREALRRDWEKAKQTATMLQTLAKQRLQSVEEKLHSEIGGFSSNYRFFVDHAPYGESRDHYFRRQIIETAKSLDYFANTTEYRAWTRLVLHTDTRAEILVSFHAIGYEFRGLIAASTCFFRREEIEEEERELTDLTTVSDEVFQINYREREDQTKQRFERWLEHGLVKALEIWRKGL